MPHLYPQPVSSAAQFSASKRQQTEMHLNGYPAAHASLPKIRNRLILCEQVRMDQTPKQFELAIPIRPEDIDQLGHVNNVIYLRWVQDVATAHWQAEAPVEDQNRLRWVVVRHEIDYKRPALPHDSVIARTWVGAASRFRFERLTELLRAADRRLLAKARTLWCPIDAQTGRPTDVSADVRARFSVGQVSEPTQD